jgi:hypothetical protein
MVLKKNGLPPDSSYTTIDYISGRIAGEYQADAFGAECQSQYFLQVVSAVSRRWL